MSPVITHTDPLLLIITITGIISVCSVIVALILLTLGRRCRHRKATFTQLLLEHEQAVERSRELDFPVKSPDARVRTYSEPGVSFPIQASAEDFVQKCRCACHRAGGATVKHVVACCVNGLVSGWGVQEYDRTDAAVIDWSITKGAVFMPEMRIWSTPPCVPVVGQASSGVLNLSILLRNQDLMAMMRREVSSVKVGL